MSGEQPVLFDLDSPPAPEDSPATPTRAPETTRNSDKRPTGIPIRDCDTSGPTALVTVRTDLDPIEEHHHVWTGYTAGTALKNRLHRLREAHADVTRDGMTLTIRRKHDGQDWTETLTFTEGNPT